MLNVYAAEPGYFRSEKIALLEQAAAYISFALDNFTREEERPPGRGGRKTIRRNR